MKDEVLKSKLKGSMKVKEGVDISVQNPQLDNTGILYTSANAVMCSYQDANKWLDIVKEHLLMDLGCVFFSTYVHNLAHTMPVRFDKFGDILHTADIKIPYPATTYIPYELSDINSCFNAIFETLGRINESLRSFINSTEGTSYHSMACSAEELLISIDSESTNLHRMQRAYANCGDIIKFDAWVGRYVDHLDSILG